MNNAPTVDTIISRLRPRDVGGIIDQAFRLYRRHFWTFLAIIAVVYVPVQALIQAVTILFLGSFNNFGNTTPGGFSSSERLNASLNQMFANLAVYGGAFALLTLLATVLQYLSQGALTAAVADSYLDRPVTFANAYRELGGRVGSLLGYIGLFVLVVL